MARRVEALTVAAAAALASIRRWGEDRRAWRKLAAMSERELQDIGVCRADIVRDRRDGKGSPYWPP
ncbi:DUF1127 domain-containing protein [Bradyrhizobium sp. USDA 4452]